MAAGCAVCTEDTMTIYNTQIQRRGEAVSVKRKAVSNQQGQSRSAFLSSTASCLLLAAFLFSLCLCIASYYRADARTNDISKKGAQRNSQALAVSMKINETITAHRVGADFAVTDFHNAAWTKTEAVPITRYWSGAHAPATRHAEARVLWSASALYVRFVARQDEPLIVNEKPRIDQKTLGLWDRDVCELFIAPNAAEPERYFEFEVAPTGEWVDLSIHILPDKRETDWEYHSGATFAALRSKDQIILTMRIPFAALGGAPQAGARWRANFFRCIGAGDRRGYLAWQPTLTPQPAFHVPQRFGWIQFSE